MSSTAQLLNDLESMKNMLMATACGGDRGDPAYVDLRKSLIRTSIGTRLPRFIHSCRSLAEFWGFIQPKFAHYAERTAYLVEEFAPLLDELERADLHPGLAPIQEVLAKVDGDHVRDAWQKALDRRVEDPEGAITAARTLLETVCKHILDSCSVPYSDKEELPALLVVHFPRRVRAKRNECMENEALLGSCSLETGISACGRRTPSAIPR